jgi:(p)ppGpp synthase/HD superfamily hydrolase
MDVASILLKNSAPDVVVIAGLLHSIKKESKIDMGEVENKFGETVLTFVRAVSELDQTDNPSLLSVDENMWKERNEACLKALETVGRDVKLLFCADKLASIRDMMEEENIHGSMIWDHFIAGKESHKWYYDRLLRSFESQPHSIIDSPMYKQLKRCVEQFFSDTT